MSHAILVLTIGDINSSIKKYIRQYNTPCFIHAKEPDKIDASFKHFCIPKYVPTKWGDFSIVTATIALLEAALQHNYLYYILISGDSILNLNKKLTFTSSIFSGKDNKAEQWFVLNKTDAKIILNTQEKYRKRYKHNNKINKGAPDELYFINVLKKEHMLRTGKPYIYKNASVLYTRWILPEVKHPTTFNILTDYDINECIKSGAIGIRKCTDTIRYGIPKQVVYLSIVGSETNQEDLYSNIDFNIYDLIILTPLENGIIPKLKERCVSITFFYYGTMNKFITEYNIKMRTYLSQWESVIFIPERA